MKKLFLFILTACISIVSLAQTKWTIDPVHSLVNFSVKNSGISVVDGSFKKFDGTIMSTNADLTDSKVNFTVNTASINTSVEMLDKHLKTDDFFNIERYPNMTFVSTSFKKAANKSINIYHLRGKLTIKNVTKEVVFIVNYGGNVKDQQGNTKAVFLANTTINRLDYNMKYPPQLVLELLKT